MKVWLERDMVMKMWKTVNFYWESILIQYQHLWLNLLISMNRREWLLGKLMQDQEHMKKMRRPIKALNMNKNVRSVRERGMCWQDVDRHLVHASDVANKGTYWKIVTCLQSSSTMVVKKTWHLIRLAKGECWSKRRSIKI